MIFCFALHQVESSNGDIGHEVVSVTSQTELDRKKAGMSLPLGQAKFVHDDIQTPQDGPDEESGEFYFYLFHQEKCY